MNLFKDTRGISTLEIVLIVVILVGLVLIFKEQISALVTSAFSNINATTNRIIK